MLFHSLRKAGWAVVLSCGCLSVSLNGAVSNEEAALTYYAEERMAISTWLDASKTPVYAIWDGAAWGGPGIILGARAGSSGVTAMYDPVGHTVVVTWRNAQKIPTYAVWNGASWSIRATRIPPLSRRRANSDVTTVYNAQTRMIVATWLSLSNTPVSASWNGTTWSTPVRND